MNVNSLIISALASLSIPVVADAYSGTATEYITFNYSDERPVNYADDEDINESATIQVHYFTKTNPLVKKETIKTLLKAAGFVYINTENLYETDTEFRHIIVSVWTEG